jgi:uncharacterized membrane-anchored protein YjiN (DUF445 family)
MSTPYTESVYVRLARAEDEAKQMRLAQMRWLATGILIVFTVLYMLSVGFAKSSAVWPYIGAFAEAAMVGALADWFAVSALFRHPLGLSFIPHTAIIPKNKDRIADNLGEFVQGEFFSVERITATVVEFDPATQLSTWLVDQNNADAVGAGAVKLLTYGLAMLDKDAVHALLRKVLSERFGEIDLSSLAARILQSLTKDGRHQVVLNEVLGSASDYLNDPEVKGRLVNVLAEKMPVYLESLKMKSANYLIEKLVDFLCELLEEVDQNPEHVLRADFDAAVQSLIGKLGSDPDFRARVTRYQRQIVANDALTDYVENIWADFSAWLRDDLASRQSIIREKLTNAAHAMGLALQTDPALRRAINDAIMSQVPQWVDRARPKIGQFISGKMKEWKDHEIVEKLELNIGRDLQFIRLNGTFVGGLIGLAIHVMTVAFH